MFLLIVLGDIRFPFAEDKEKITKLVHSQIFPLGDIYLNLLTSIPGFFLPSLDEATTYDAFVSKTQEIANFKSSDFSQKQDSKPIDSASSTPKLEREDRERKSQSLGQKRTDRGILSVSKLPSSLGVNGHLSSDVLNLLSKFHQQLATNARERLIESGSGVNPNRIDPISTEMREFKSQILSEHFLIHVRFLNKSTEMIRNPGNFKLNVFLGSKILLMLCGSTCFQPYHIQFVKQLKVKI